LEKGRCKRGFEKFMIKVFQPPPTPLLILYGPGR
jgi:hypothetical protein